eukprot:jgi/Mesvir1/3526/Mv11999-RA.1
MTGAENSLRYLPYRKEKPNCVLRLFAFHWAGGSASAYRFLEKSLGDEVELCAVQLPGREARLNDTTLASLQAYAREIVEALKHLFQGPARCAIFGHSMGSWLAYEVACEVQRQDLPHPTLLVVSDFPSPSIPLKERPWTPCTGMTDAQFKDECRRWGVKEAVFQPDIWETFRDSLRADFCLFDTYEHAAGDAASAGDGAKLACPVLVFASEDDPKVGKHCPLHISLADAWRQHTLRPVTKELFPGDHFYLTDAKVAQSQFASRLAMRLNEIADLLAY